MIAHAQDNDYEKFNIIVRKSLHSAVPEISLSYDKKVIKQVDVRRGLKCLKFIKTNWGGYIYIQINASHLIGYSEPRKRIRITVNDFDRIYLKLNELIETLNTDMYSLSSVDLTVGKEFAVSRIDYAVDINTPYAAEYIRLLKKGKKPPRLIEQGYRESLYYTNGSKKNKLRRAINCYDKAEFSRKRGIRAEKDTLRFEVQLGIKQIEKMLEKYNLTYCREYMETGNLYYLLEISSYVLQTYYEKLVHRSDFYTKAYIEEKIQTLSEHQQIKIKAYLKEIVKKGASLKDINLRYKETVKLLESMGINPIPLKASIGKKFLPSLYGFLDGDSN